MKGYGQYCPIARGAEIFAERWTPLIVRNILIGSTTFGQIEEGSPGIPRSVLSQRLRHLEHHGVIERRPAGRRSTYHLTECGEELAAVCHALGVWGARWLETTHDHLDAHLVLWFWAKLIDRDALPSCRVVVRFDLADDSRPNRYWVLLSTAQREVCVQHPGFSEDLIVITDSSTLVDWHSGEVTLEAAKRSGRLRMDGPSRLIRDFGRWGGLSPFAAVGPARAGRSKSRQMTPTAAR